MTCCPFTNADCRKVPARRTLEQLMLVVAPEYTCSSRGHEALQVTSLRPFRALGSEVSSFGLRLESLGFLPLVSREWKNGSNSSYNCPPNSSIPY